MDGKDEEIKSFKLLKKTENEHLENEEFLENIVENIPNMIFIKSADKLNFEMVNKAVEYLLGYSREELIGKTDYDFFTKDKADFFTQKDRKVLQNKKLLDIPEETIETKNFGQRILHTKKIPIFNKEGNPQYLLGISEDITELKKVEKALEESEERFSITLDAVNDGLWEWDIPSGNAFFSPNYYKLLGYNPGEFPANYTSWRLLMHPDDIDFVEKKLEESIKSGIGFEIDLRMKTKSGKWLWVSKRGKAIEKDSTGIATRKVGTLTDITERVNAEKKIKKSLEEKEMLLKEIHHRVKNNLMIISSLLNLQSRYIKDKASQNVFKESQNRARSMALIHERLYQSTDLERINYGDYIRSLATELFHTYEADPGLIKLKINVEDILLDINTAIPLGLIVNELITNSLTHAFSEGNRGKINIDFHPIDDHYEFAVKDNGIGFPEDIDFQNTDSLGLQLINSLTNQIDGDIKLDRNNGTEFKIIFKELECNKG